MTALCAGGPSQPKPGYTGTITFDGVSVGAGLALAGFPELDVILGPLIAGAVLVVELFCASDPPADPHPTQQDLTDAINLQDPLVSQPAIQKFVNWFLHWYWCQVCTCASGASPNCGGLSNPGTVTQNPGLPSGANAPCFTGAHTVDFPAPTTIVQLDITNSLLPTNGASITNTSVVGGFAGRPVTLWPIPTGVTELIIDSETLGFDPGLLPSENAEANFFTSTGPGLTTTSYGIWAASGAGPSHNDLRPGVGGVWVSGATYWGIAAIMGPSAHSTGVHDSGSLTSTVNCGGPLLEQPCCPPDPNITAKLDQLYGLVLSLYQSAPAPVSSWAEGVTVSGLSGDGQLTVAGAALAIKVTLTTIPPWIGMDVSSPTFYFEVGFIAFTTIEGTYSGQKVTYAQQVYSVPPMSSSINYSFERGVIASITTLTRGP